MPALNYGDDTDNANKSIQYYYGGHGNDLVGGTAEADELYGGAGNDTLVGGSWGLSGSGLNAGTLANPLLLTVGSPTGNDYLEGGTGADIIHGFDGDDEIYGGGGDDSGQAPSNQGHFFTIDGTVGQGLYGGTGDDYINGGTGNDALFGGDGADYLIGSYGEDEITGGVGADDMIGGGDSDTFIFLSLDELDGDRIGDFDHKKGDIIDLSAIDAKEGGSDNKFKYIGDDDFSGKGQISFHNGKLKFNTDGDNGTEAVMFVNTDKLSKGDFDL